MAKKSGYGSRSRRRGGGLGSRVIIILVVLTVIFTGWRAVPGEGDDLMSTLKAKNASLKSWYENKNLDGIKLPDINFDPPSLGGGPTGGSKGGSEGSGASGKPTMTKAQAEKALNSLKVGEPKKVDYDRDDWKHWTNVRTCWSTRDQVLYEEAEKGSTVLLDSHGKKTKDVKKACKIESGKWKGLYTGKTFNDPSKMDIDHYIPLSYTAKQGGQTWSKSKKEAYANDLDFKDHLIAVDASANRKKSDKGPSQWKPSNKNYYCTYATSWIQVSKNYKLTVPKADKAALKEMLKSC